jgi:hypothetical protein
MSAHDRLQAEIHSFDVLYTSRHPTKPTAYKKYRRVLRKGLWDHVTWGGVFDWPESYKKSLEVYLKTEEARSRLSTFLYTTGLTSFAGECPVGTGSLRQAIASVSLRVAEEMHWTERGYIKDFVWRLACDGFSDDKDFWKSLFIIIRHLLNEEQLPAYSPPPYFELISEYEQMALSSAQVAEIFGLSDFSDTPAGQQ